MVSTASSGSIIPAPPRIGSAAFIVLTNRPPDEARAPATEISPSGPAHHVGHQREHVVELTVGKHRDIDDFARRGDRWSGSALPSTSEGTGALMVTSSRTVATASCTFSVTCPCDRSMP